MDALPIPSFAGLLLLAAAACGPSNVSRPKAPEREPASIVLPAVSASLEDSARASLATTPPLHATRASRCVLASAPPVIAPPSAVVGKACRVVPGASQTSIRTVLSKRFEKTHDHGKPKVTFPCDGLGPRIHEVVLETGSGHGFGLELWRARLTEDGARYEVRGIAYAGGGYVKRSAQALPYRIASGQLDGQVLASAIEEARSALSSEVHEEVPPPPTGANGAYGVDGTSFTFSSADFHVLLKLTDTDGRTTEKEFTGYRGNSAQEAFLSVALAAEKLKPLIDAFPFEERPVGDEDRDYFAERFNASAVRFDESFHWWVTERYVALSKDFASPALVRTLLTRLAFTDSDRSKVDARVDAVEALARITQWDARMDQAGHPVSVEQAARSYLDACRDPANPVVTPPPVAPPLATP